MLGLPALLAAGLMLTWGGSVARADHTVFDYAVERFEADGNIFGSADGVFDLIDEFDDGILGPTFGHLFGTTIEQNGAMHLKNPGTHFSLNFPWTLDQSDVNSTSQLVREGHGAGVYRTIWVPTAIGVNHYLHMTFWAGTDVVGIALTNFDETITNLYDPPDPSAIGLRMTAHHERFENFALTNVSLEHHPIDAVPGAIVFELRFDDTTRTVSVGFSVDGGATFDRGFAPMPIGFAPGSQAGATILVGADPYEANAAPPPPECPLTFFLDQATIKNGGGPAGKGALTLHGAIGNDLLDPLNQGMTLLLVDMGAGGGEPAWTVAIPPGGPGSGCDPRDGWRSGSRGRASYRNVSGAFPPGCAPGTAGGLVKAKTKAAASDVRVMVKRATLPSLVGPLVVGYVNPAAAAGQCGNWLSAPTACVSSGYKLRCR